MGGVLPVAALLGYTFLTTGAFPTGLRLPVPARGRGYPTLGYHAEWAVEDLRYVPQNLGILFGAAPHASLPDAHPGTLGYCPRHDVPGRPARPPALFDEACPLAIPVDIGTSVLLSAPGLLLALFAIRRHGRQPASGSRRWRAVVIVATFNLAHFSQGWVQWGYRFSLDFIPFLLPMVALGAAGRSTGGRG